MSGRACTNCGNLMPDGAQFCGRCGARPAAANPAPAPVPPPAAPFPPAAAPPVASGPPVAAKTVLGVPSPLLGMPGFGGQPAPQPPAAPPIPPASPSATAPLPAHPIAYAPSPSPIASAPPAPQPVAFGPHPTAPAPVPPQPVAPQPIAPQPAAPQGSGGGTPIAARTMLGFSAPAELQSLLASPAAAPVAPSAAAPAPQPAFAQQPPQAAPQAPPPQTPPGGLAGAKTMLGIPSPEVLAQIHGRAAPQAAPPMQAAPAQAPQGAPPPQPAPVGVPAPAQGPAPQGGPVGMKTMLGVAVPGIAPTYSPPPAQAPAQPPPQAAAAQAPAGGGPVGSKTILGVAVPGIAPTHPAPQGNIPMKTMLGVAAPGIAPMNPGQAAQPAPAWTPPPEPLPQVVPAPQAPSFEDPLPSAPRPAQKRGFPIAAVAIIGLVVVLLVGGSIAFFMRGGAPIQATAGRSASGNEQLHLKCETCPDGTTATVGSSKTSFVAKEADLELAEPLHVGDNAFAIAIDRPGVGRDETVKLTLPVSYRIAADLSHLGDASPTIGVSVEATPGSTVTLDGKPVALDGSGKATVSFDVATETTGFADETKSLDKKWSYVVTPAKGEAATGEVTAKLPIVLLHLDAPLARHVTAAKTVWVTGRTTKDATVTVDGESAKVNADGTFEKEVTLKDGENKLAVVATGAPGKAAPRSGTVLVRKVASVDAELATAAKGAGVLSSWDAFGSAVDANIGKSVYFEGTVIEGRVPPHQALVLVDDAKGCAKSPCMLRVVYGSDVALNVQSGKPVRGFGRIARAFSTKDGKTLPEVEAEILIAEAK